MARIILDNDLHRFDAQTFIFLVSSCKALWSQARSDHRLRDFMQDCQEAGDHKMRVLQYAKKQLRKPGMQPTILVSRLNHVAGCVNIRLKYQVSCPEFYARHKECLDSFVTRVQQGWQKVGTKRAWAESCVATLRGLPTDNSDFSYFSCIARMFADTRVESSTNRTKRTAEELYMVRAW